MTDLPAGPRFPSLSPLLRLAFIGSVATVIFLCLLPGRDLPDVGLSDKLEHVIAYVGMALLGGLAYPGRRPLLPLALGLPALGIAIEFCQLFVPGRSAEVADAVADTIGVAIGLLLVPLARLVLDLIVRRAKS